MKPHENFDSFDVAKTVGNAYDLLEQVLGKETLSKDSFSMDEIAAFPQGYKFERMSLKVVSMYKSESDLQNAWGFNVWPNKTDTRFTNLFFNSFDDMRAGKPATDIFNNNNCGKEGSGVFINAHGEKYTNKDGSITKGGLVAAILNSNTYDFAVGETTLMGLLLLVKWLTYLHLERMKLR